MTVPWKEVMRPASDMLLDAGVINDYHKNDLVIKTLASDKRFKDVEFYFILPKVEEQGYALCYVYLSRDDLTAMTDSEKLKVINDLRQNLKEYLKVYEVAVRYRVYGKKTKTPPFYEAQYDHTEPRKSKTSGQ